MVLVCKSCEHSQFRLDNKSLLASYAKFDVGASKIDYNVTEAPVVKLGVFNLTTTQAPMNSIFDVCVHVFKTDTGHCADGVVTANLPKEEGKVQDVLVFTRISPVFYSEPD